MTGKKPTEKPRDVPGGITLRDAQELERAAFYGANQVGISGRCYSVLSAVIAYTVTRRRMFDEVYLGALAAFAFGVERSTESQQGETRKHLGRLHKEGLILRAAPPSHRPEGKDEGAAAGGAWRVELVDWRSLPNRGHWRHVEPVEKSGETPLVPDSESRGKDAQKSGNVPPPTKKYQESPPSGGRARGARESRRSTGPAQAPTVDELDDPYRGELRPRQIHDAIRRQWPDKPDYPEPALVLAAWQWLRDLPREYLPWSLEVLEPIETGTIRHPRDILDHFDRIVLDQGQDLDDLPSRPDQLPRTRKATA